MNNLKIILLISPLIFLATGCGKLSEKFGRIREGESRVTFALAGDEKNFSSFNTLQGRALVYLVGVNGTNFTTNLELDNETSDYTVVVPNGQYKVYAVGWAGPNSVEGQSYCGFGSSGNVISLQGGATTVPIGMTVGNCDFTNSSIFADAGLTDSTNFSSLSINFCNGITGTPSCTANDNGYGGNYLKFNFDIYRSDSVGYQRLGNFEFGCGFINTNNAASSKRIPLGNSSGAFPKIFAVNFSVHTDSSCTSAPVITFAARNGIRNGASSGAAASASTSSGPSAIFYVDPL